MQEHVPARSAARSSGRGRHSSATWDATQSVTGEGSILRPMWSGDNKNKNKWARKTTRSLPLCSCLPTPTFWRVMGTSAAFASGFSLLVRHLVATRGVTGTKGTTSVSLQTRHPSLSLSSTWISLPLPSPPPSLSIWGWDSRLDYIYIYSIHYCYSSTFNVILSSLHLHFQFMYYAITASISPIN